MHINISSVPEFSFLPSFLPGPLYPFSQFYMGLDSVANMSFCCQAMYFIWHYVVYSLGDYCRYGNCWNLYALGTLQKVLWIITSTVDAIIPDFAIAVLDSSDGNLASLALSVGGKSPGAMPCVKKFKMESNASVCNKRSKEEKDT